ncbi:MAG: glycosyltransferase [Candidatus Marinimicrobia bacterium]|nr:glycosyltransferase [Candidatus Neomarinimicrobiota bacterium]MCF7850492.1 glycosyltransferase [Candidatus Neomarinimicrobiota bacterium]
MQVTVIPSWYPNNYQPFLGTFIREQVSMMKGNDLSMHLLGAIPISVKFGIRPLALEPIETPFVKFFPSIPGLRHASYKRSLSKGMKMFEKYIQTHGEPDLLHIHSYLQGYLALAIREKYDLPFVVTEHYTRLLNATNLARWEYNLAKQLYSKSAGNFAVSNYFADILQANFGVEFHTIPNFINMDRFVPAHGENDNQDYQLISIGALTKRKGMDILLNSVHILHRKGLTVSLKIIGDGEERDTLQSYCRQSGIESQVTFLPFVSNSELPHHLQSADCFVIASEVETFGVVVVEALASGVPSIVTAEAPKMFIQNGYNGYISDRDPESLADRIEQCMRLNSTPEQIRETVSKKYSAGVVKKQLLDTYQSVIA